MDWTEETILRLRGLWAEGHSTAEIGRRLGVTKNAVVGKAHRLDLPARPSPIRREGTPGVQPRRPAPRRVAGPTLPPLSSSSQATEAVVRSVGVNPGLVSVMPSRSEVARTETYRPMPAAPEPERAEPARAEVPRPAPYAVTPPVRVAAAPRPYARSLTCCWPIGEPGTKTFRFCDDGAVAGKPYCASHAALAYVKVRDRREDAA
jgi:GcrA cell cycle regulator